MAFGEAVYEAEATVEGIVARRAEGLPDVRAALESGAIPVLVDPLASCRSQLKPLVLVDAIMAKRNTGTTTADAPLVIGLGPGFTAGIDCHAVIETNRGHAMGRVLWQGQAEPNTAMPGEVAGHRTERVLRHLPPAWFGLMSPSATR